MKMERRGCREFVEADRATAGAFTGAAFLWNTGPFIRLAALLWRSFAGTRRNWPGAAAAGRGMWPGLQCAPVLTIDVGR
jgi:hypothetical protein